MRKIKKDYTGIITSLKNIALNTFEMKIESKLDSCTSGQFISILCPNKTLRRPFSISNFENGIITILFKLKGEGTDYLKKLNIGDKIKFLAPLGGCERDQAARLRRLGCGERCDGAHRRVGGACHRILGFLLGVLVGNPLLDGFRQKA